MNATKKTSFWNGVTFFQPFANGTASMNANSTCTPGSATRSSFSSSISSRSCRCLGVSSLMPGTVHSGAMYDHVTIRVSDREASLPFYDLLLGRRTGESDVYVEWDDFSLAEATAEKPVTQRLHVGFYAPSREAVDAFWQRGVDAGYRSDGEPGPRPQYSEDYYGGFLLDPDGNSIEAVTHDDPQWGRIDH